MEIFVTELVKTIVWVTVGIIAAVVSFRVFDALHPADLTGEVQKGNLAAGVVSGAIILGSFILVAAITR